MNVYVIGAGVSKQVGYPLAGELFSRVEKFVASAEGSKHGEKWNELCGWLKCNGDVLLREAYQRRDFEGIFTILDLARKLRLDASRKVVSAIHNGDNTAAQRAGACADNLCRETIFHAEYRETMLLALGDFFQTRHRGDLNNRSGQGWDLLREFGERLRPGDAVITFNYDATLERVLSEQGKWTPTKGYGFRVDLDFDPKADRAAAELGSAVKILHLHGCVGWFDGGASHIALSRGFLQFLGVNAVDRSMPDEPKTKPMLIHPSFIKSFEQGYGGLADLWRQAGGALKGACRVFVIGYSLPEADGAALALLVTNTDRNRVQIVNVDRKHSGRLRQLLGSWRAPAFAYTAPGLKLEDWLAG